MAHKKVDPDKFCAYCGKQLFRKMINGRLEDRGIFLKRKYCDRACMAKGQIQTEVSIAGYRTRSAKLRGDHCEQCGTTQNLHVHHMDLNPANNDIGNIQTLCASCHLKWHWANGKKMLSRQTVCVICGEPSRKLDMCQKHYQRFKKYGNPLLTKVRKGDQYVLAQKD